MLITQNNQILFGRWELRNKAEACITGVDFKRNQCYGTITINNVSFILSWSLKDLTEANGNSQWDLVAWDRSVSNDNYSRKLRKKWSNRSNSGSDSTNTQIP
jgi:hypothetical protein